MDLHALRDELCESHFGNPTVALEAFKHFESLFFLWRAKYKNFKKRELDEC